MDRYRYIRLDNNREEISTNLEDAGYFCGPFRLRNGPCSIGKNKRIDQSTCAFSR